MKQSQYRKYKEVFRVDLNILKKTIKDCDAKINEINNEIAKRNVKINKKQKGGRIQKTISNEDVLYMLIPAN